MRIIEIELYQYKRFSLSRTKMFRYKIEQKSQIILGTNGSGKSSLLSELSPLPSKSKNFYDGGYKKITIEHSGSLYILTSDYNNKHSILKDSIELNEGKTYTVQKQLVMNEFNINDKLFSILSGKINFCDMNAGDRRKWFTYLSDNDYDYISTVYDRIKEKYNTLQSDLKSVMNFKEKELKMEMTEADVLDIKKSIISYRDSIDALNTLKQNINSDDLQINSDIKSIEREIHDSIILSRRYLKEINYPILSTMTVSELYNKLNIVIKNIHYNDGKLEELINRHEILLSQINSITDSDSRKDIIVRLNDIDNELSNLDELNIDNISELYHCYRSVKIDIENSLMYLPSNQDKRYSKESLEKIEKRLSELSSQLFIHKKEEDRLRQIINTQESSLSDTNLVECPECTNKWHLGYNETLHKDSIENLELVLLSISKMEDEKTLLIKEKESISEYSVQYRTLMNLFKQYPSLLYVYDRVKDILIDNPQAAIQTLNSLSIDIEKQYKVYTLLEEKRSIEKNTILPGNDSEKIKNDLMNNKEILENEISNTVIEKNKNKELESIYLSQIKIIEKIDNQFKYINSLSSKLDSLIDRGVKSVFNNSINEVTRDLLTAMLQYQNKLSDNEQHVSAVTELQIQEDEIKSSLEVVKLLETVLSPKSGIIADSLIGFINTILSYINRFVSDIWTYPIEIILVEICDESDVLDYKFKVKINDFDIIDDISEASSGLKEIINLGFKICVMSYLNFKGYPIYLDEFGSTFDMQHRLNTSFIISELVNDDMFSNIFMVSHYEESYGSMKNTDIVIMHDSNISIPNESTFNKNVLIESY